MKVGKPKSKRTPVRLRQGIQKASAAKQRKHRKEAKKNPQWRSKLKKDPGIPNLFPYKAKILAEIEDNKRKKEEEAQRKREVAKAQRQGIAMAVDYSAVPEVDEDGGDEELQDLDDAIEEMDEQDDSNPMAALLASAQARAQAFARDDEADGEDEDEDGEEEWDGIENKTKSTSTQPAQKSLPKQALADPIKAVSALLDRLQRTTDGIQQLLDHYQTPPLITAGTDLTTSFLVEVARKRGRLGSRGVPNLHSAALTVLTDLNEEKLDLPSVVDVASTRAASSDGKREAKVVSKMAEPFRIEGLWGDDADGGGVAVEEEMVVES